MPQIKFRSSCSRRGARFRRGECAKARAAAATKDAFIANALELVPLSVAPIEQLKGEQQQAVAQLSAAQMPTRADESFRFTNISKLLKNRLQPPSDAPSASKPVSYPQISDDAAQLVFINGQVDAEASKLQDLPDTIYTGSLSSAPAEARAALGGLSSQRGGVFTWLNAATSGDVQVCYLPAGAECNVPLHIVSVSSSAAEAGHAVMYSPRLLIVAEEGAKIEVVEEFVGEGGAGNYFMNSVTEIVLAKNASVSHRLVQTEAEGAFHIKNTFVQQEQSSSYELVEASLGGQLSRHDVNIQQGGEKTSTTLRHFLLCGAGQVHDLHTSLVLDYPEGTADQLHKCIVSDATGHGIFDGNVQVNKPAQRTDAGQLSRNLLLEPKATVNVKPNLQIIADDVKCTHGCAVSDLSDAEMFYFRARGIDAEVARKALVYSFGAEIVQLFDHKELVDRTRSLISSKLDVAS